MNCNDWNVAKGGLKYPYTSTKFVTNRSLGLKTRSLYQPTCKSKPFNKQKQINLMNQL